MTIINSSTASGVLSSRGILRALILLSLFIFAPILPSAATYYIAPSGSNSNPGTQAQPFATLQKAHDVAVAGDTICMRGGTYLFPAQTTLTRDGASGKHIKVFNYPGEVPVIDGIDQPGGVSARAIILMDGASWWRIEGLELKNGPINGIVAQSNSSNNIFERLQIHHMGRLANGGGAGTALRVGAGGINNLVLNNDVHDNDDELSFGGGANGISVSGAGSGNVIRGNRAWRNADDGIDMWNAAPALIENNWVWLSGYDQDGVTPRGNGMGFKLGGSGPNDGGHTVQNNLSWKNLVDGFHENGGDLPMKMYNNTAWSNVRQSFTFFNSATTFRNNLGPASSIPGSYPYNSWTLPVTVSDADFASLDLTCAGGPRQADGSLPNCSFLRLAAGSDLIDKGTNVGIP